MRPGEAAFDPASGSLVDVDGGFRDGGLVEDGETGESGETGEWGLLGLPFDFMYLGLVSSGACRTSPSLVFMR